MRIANISIKNFRSVSDKPVILNFEKDRNLYAFIGANNSGKTNLLDAVGLALGAGKFYHYRIEEADFYNKNINNDIEIIVNLADPLTYRDVYQKPCEIQKITFGAREYRVSDYKGSIRDWHYCSGLNGKGQWEDPLLDSQRIYKAKKSSEDESVDNRKLPVEAKDILPQLGNVYYLEPQWIYTFCNMSKRGPLANLFRIYKDDFPKPENRYKDSKSSVEAFNECASEIKNILKTEKLAEIESKLMTNFSKYLGLDEARDLKIHMGLPAPEDFMDKVLELSVKENAKLEDLSVAKLGSGYLSLFRLAVIQTLAEMNEARGAIFLIEEPEVYLHPHLRRFFYKILKQLATNGNQIIYSTHSVEFVDLEEYRSIIKVDKAEKAYTVTTQMPPDTQLNFNRMERKIREKGNEEVYFAKFAVLTEGQKDQTAFNILFDKKGVDKDSKSISIVDCRGKGNIKDYIELCKELKINYFVIVDYDKGNEKSMSETSAILSALGRDKEKYHMFEQNLETELGLSKNSSADDVTEKLLQLSMDDVRKKYPNIFTAAETCFKLIEKRILPKLL